MTGLGLAIGAGVLASVSAYGWAPAHRAPQPSHRAVEVVLQAAGAPVPSGVSVRWSRDAFEALESATDTILIRALPLDDGRSVDLVARRFDVFPGDARVVVSDGVRERVVAPPRAVSVRGHVLGAEDSSVVISLTPDAMNGLVRLGGRTYSLSSGPTPTPGLAVVAPMDGLMAGALDRARMACHSTDLGGLAGQIFAQPERSDAPAHEADAPARGTRSGEPCRLVTLSIETDTEFTVDLFAGNPTASAAYAGALVAAASSILQDHAGVVLQIGYLRLYTGPDPWNAPHVNGQIVEWANVWNMDGTGLPRNAAHFLSGRSLGGGVAFIGTLCSNSFDYGVSSGLNGFFPTPLSNNQPQNWDPFVFTHELGHTLGAGHTHDLSPSIDDCDSDPCSTPTLGTLMSYCHLCPGGVGNIGLVFHPRTIDEEILPLLNSGLPCDLLADAPQIQTHPQGTSACHYGSMTLGVSATGDGLSYAWRRNGVAIPGATGPTLVLSPATRADAGVYDVVVRGVCGQVVSDPASVSVGSCGADINSDCTLDAFDFNAFVDAFNAGDLVRADQNADTTLDAFDFNAFVDAFNAGCP